MPIRSFSLNSPEAYEALGGRREEPWIPNGALPREPRDGPAATAACRCGRRRMRRQRTR